jgi:hypothetical protein
LRHDRYGDRTVQDQDPDNARHDRTSWIVLVQPDTVIVGCHDRNRIRHTDPLPRLIKVIPTSHSNHNSYRFLGPFESRAVFCTTSIASSTLLMLVACQICCGVAICVG